MATPISTNIHLRLAEEHGKSFERRMVQLGYSAMSAGEPGYYYLTKGNARVLMQQEVSGDFVLHDYMVSDPDDELIEILKKVVLKFQGNMDLRCGDPTKQIKIEDGAYVQVEENKPEADEEVRTPRKSKGRPGMPDPSSDMTGPADSNIPQARPPFPGNGVPFPQHDPRAEMYHKMALNAIGKIMTEIGDGSLTFEEALVQGERIKSALILYSGTKDGLLDLSEQEGLIKEAKQNVELAKRAAAIQIQQKTAIHDNSFASLPPDLMASPQHGACDLTAIPQLVPSSGSLAAGEGSVNKIDTDDLETFFLNQIGGK